MQLITVIPFAFIPKWHRGLWRSHYVEILANGFSAWVGVKVLITRGEGTAFLAPKRRGFSFLWLLPCWQDSCVGSLPALTPRRAFYVTTCSTWISYMTKNIPSTVALVLASFSESDMARYILRYNLNCSIIRAKQTMRMRNFHDTVSRCNLEDPWPSVKLQKYAEDKVQSVQRISMDMSRVS